ncbi:hypothetical protein FXO38_18449 [Capsicum annuum]|nr:hypothetical protein FXO38_18449 [Capsicum annuum]
MEKVNVIRDRLKAAQSRQKSYADVRHRELEFEVGDWVFLKVSPMKRVMRFGKKGRLSPRILVFQIPCLVRKSLLKFWIAKFVGCGRRMLASVKVLWRNHKVEEATWKIEEDMKSKYLFLFFALEDHAKARFHALVYFDYFFGLGFGYGRGHVPTGYSLVLIRGFVGLLWAWAVSVSVLTLALLLGWGGLLGEDFDWERGLLCLRPVRYSPGQIGDWVLDDGKLTQRHVLRSHQKPVSFVAWSPDDTMLLTCGNIEVLNLWDVETGTCKHTYGDAGFIISSCAWFPDSKRFVCGSSDPEKGIYMWDCEGNEIRSWKGMRMPKVLDLAITADGEKLISIFSDRDIRILNVGTSAERVISEAHPLTSLSLSGDGKFFIVNLNSQEIHMWDIAGKWLSPLKFKGHRQHKYVIRSCFGGLDSTFIASGSEDSKIAGKDMMLLIS